MLPHHMPSNKSATVCIADSSHVIRCALYSLCLGYTDRLGVIYNTGISLGGRVALGPSDGLGAIATSASAITMFLHMPARGDLPANNRGFNFNKAKLEILFICSKMAT